MRGSGSSGTCSGWGTVASSIVRVFLKAAPLQRRVGPLDELGSNAASRQDSILAVPLRSGQNQ